MSRSSTLVLKTTLLVIGLSILSIGAAHSQQNYFRDQDRDGYGNVHVRVTATNPPPGYVTDSTDCTDLDATIFPGGPEYYDGKDNDCDGKVDEGDHASYTVLPAKIEAENWSYHSGAGTESTSDVGGGLNVGYMDPGNWVEYNIYSPVLAVYQLSLRVSSPHDHSVIEVRAPNGSLYVRVPVPNTGGWQNWQTISVPIRINPGNFTLRLFSAGTGYWNLNWLDFSSTEHLDPSYVTIPARIEAEHFTRADGVHTETTTDAGGGLNLHAIDAGDFMEYKINVPATGMYTIGFRIATPNALTQFQLRIGKTVFIPVNLPTTGGNQSWVTITRSVLLEKGPQKIWMMSTKNNWNLNWLELVQSASLPTNTELLTFNPWVFNRVINAYGTPSQSVVYDRHAQVQAMDVSKARIKFNAGGTWNGLDKGSNMLSGQWNFQNGELQIRASSGSTTLTADILKLTPTQFDWRETSTNTKGEMIPVTANHFAIPGKIEGENWSAMSGVETEATTDAGSGSNVGFIDNGDWMNYNIRVPQGGAYQLTMRVATIYSNTLLLVRFNSGAPLATFALPNTGGWQSWQTYTVDLSWLDPGDHTLHIYSAGNNWNLNWLQLEKIPRYKPVPPSIVQETFPIMPEIMLYPNPSTDRTTLQLTNELTGNVDVEVRSIHGAVVRKFRLIKNAKGMHQYSLNTSTFSKGSYMITINMIGWKKTLKMILQ